MKFHQFFIILILIFLMGVGSGSLTTMAVLKNHNYPRADAMLLINAVFSGRIPGDDTVAAEGSTTIEPVCDTIYITTKIVKVIHDTIYIAPPVSNNPTYLTK